jgi:citrate synthase
MSDNQVPLEVPPGLERVVVARTAISDVDGEGGHLRYRGRDIEEVVPEFRWEDLLTWLAGPATRDGWQPQGTTAADPMSRMVAVIVEEGRGVTGDDWDEAERFVKRLPLAVADALSGQPPVPTESLPLAGQYLARLRGRRPSDLEARSLDAYWVMAAEHSLNASTFAVRIAASTRSPLPLALAAGVATLAGPLHGGAPTGVLDLLDEAKAHRDDLAAWIAAKLDAKERIMGFGHRVYRAEDPRARALRRWFEALAETADEVAWAAQVEAEVLRQLRRRHPDRVLATNVEYYAAVVLDALGIPREWCPVTFACARLAGWTAHYYEQRRLDRLIRPLAVYQEAPHV